jgi:hypothetical protein
VSPAAVSVRVNQGGPEVWALSVEHATKLGAVSLARYVAGTWIEGASSVVTFADPANARAYEVVDGTDGATIVAIALDRGGVMWNRPVGAPIRSIELDELSDDGLRVELADGRVLGLAAKTGEPRAAPDARPPPPAGAIRLGSSLMYRAAERTLVRDSTTRVLEPTAVDPAPHHMTVDGDVLWFALPGHCVGTISTSTLQTITMSDVCPS